MSELTCPVTGDSDLYGLGVRIGIYIQMAAVQISGLASAILKTEDYLGQGTILFVLATGAVLVRELVNKTIEPVEVFPILTLLLAQVGVCRVPYWKNQSTAIIYVFELAGLAAAYVWFWWRGMDTLPRSCPDDKAFFFAKVSIWHWFRTLNKVSAIFFAIAGSMAVLFYLSTIFYFGAVRAINLARRLRGRETAPRQRDEDMYPMGFGAVDFLVNVGAIVYVEMALKWNHITDVHSLSAAGQFMPFFVALAQLASVFYGIARTGLSLAADDESSSEGDEEEEEVECHHDGGGWFSQRRKETLPMSNVG